MRPAKRIKLGFAPTRRVVFSIEEAQRQKRLVQKRLREWKVDFVNLDTVNEEGLIFDRAHAAAALELFRREKVDALFIPHVNFGTEDAVARLARDLGKPTLLWGPRDDAPLPDGNRLRDTQCGLFATSKILRRLGVPFTYIVNSRLDDEVFERGFRTFLAAAAAVKAFRGARIGQVGPRPTAFWTMIVNEGELLERWGIEVVPTTLTQILLAAQAKLEKGKRDVARQIRWIRQRFTVEDAPAQELERIAALKLAIVEWAESQGLDAVALQCWSGLQEAFGVFPCFVHGLIADEAIPVTCETDIHGAVCARMVQEAVGRATAPFFADLTVRHPDDDNAELLWHCGPFPPSTAVEGEKKLTKHFMGGVLGAGQWETKGGPLTLARFDGDHGQYQMLIGHAEGTAGPLTRGTYVWAKVRNWPLWEERVIRGPYVHHVVGVHGHIAPALVEACRFLGIQPDCVEPTEGEIQAWMRGE
jgi:L-fucose isomerase-like protein